MPRSAAAGHALSVTYWMNRLQGSRTTRQLFVTLNPIRPPGPAAWPLRKSYAHPVFDRAAMAAQRELWRCRGSIASGTAAPYFGAGFHEDGLQAGLAVAEQLGGGRRPWRGGEARSGGFWRGATPAAELAPA